MKSYYILITKEFAELMDGKKSKVWDNSYFGYTVTNDNRYVCSSNSVNDFPEDFETISPLSVIPLLYSDFPPAEEIPPAENPS